MIALGGACELPEIEYETEYALVGLDRPTGLDPLCPADLALMDEQIAFVMNALNIRPDLPIEIYLYDLSTLEAFERMGCSRGDSGCHRYVGGRWVISTAWHSLSHEIVHAVAHPLPALSSDPLKTRLPEIWFEGIAEALSTHWTQKESIGQLTGEDLTACSLTVGFPTATHFVRWLIETRGWNRLRRVAHGEPFEQVYEVTADELARAYEDEAPYYYPAFDPCPFPELPSVGEGRWGESLTISCDTPGASHAEWAHFPGPIVDRRVTLPAGVYDIEVTGGFRVHMIGCLMEIGHEKIGDWAHGDVRSEAEQAAFIPIDPGAPHRLRLTDGTYRMSVLSGTEDPLEMAVEVRRVPEAPAVESR